MTRIHTIEYSPAQGPRSPAIYLDVHLPGVLPETTGKLQTIVYFHGGGLLHGSRTAVAPHMVRAIDRRLSGGIALVSVDYRHAPQVRLPEIISDGANALRFVLEGQLATHMATLEPQCSLDLDSIVVLGGSAGGWLALMLALGIVSPLAPATTAAAASGGGNLPEATRARIKAVGALYPITDAGDGFFSVPSRPMFPPIWPDSAYDKLCDPGAPAESSTIGLPQVEPRAQFYFWAQSKGLFQQLLLSDEQRAEGWLRRTDVSAFVASAPPAHAWPRSVYLTHGDADTAVPVSQSRRLAAALREAGVDTRYEEAKRKVHIWDQIDEDEDMRGLWSWVERQLATMRG